MSITAILLAAGRAERFGSAKLHAVLNAGPDAGVPIGVAACRHLRSAIPDVIAIVRPDDRALAAALEAEGARIVVAHRADDGMGASLASGMAAVLDASGYVVALADMPWIEASTISRVVQALANGASVAAPVYRGKRGHPVGFASTHRAELLALTGDEGARAILAAHRDALTLIDVEDPGVVRDVDTPEDLR
jgi:molybdenum cofactor cytidylyltransferase